MQPEHYDDSEPTREAVDQLSGRWLIEFGASWCGHCQALAPTIEKLLGAHPQIQHLRIEDGRGKRLGRSFRVKLWPTLVLMRDGQVIHQLVRPDATELRRVMEEF